MRKNALFFFIRQIPRLFFRRECLWAFIYFIRFSCLNFFVFLYFLCQQGCDNQNHHHNITHTYSSYHLIKSTDSDFRSLRGILKTKYDQYNSQILPLQKYLLDKGVKFVPATTILDMNFEKNGSKKSVSSFVVLWTSFKRNWFIYQKTYE